MVRNFAPERVMQTIECNRVTISNLIPTMLNLMVKHPSIGEYDYSSIRVILSGGASIAPELVRSILNAFQCSNYSLDRKGDYKSHLTKKPSNV